MQIGKYVRVIQPETKYTGCFGRVVDVKESSVRVYFSEFQETVLFLSQDVQAVN